MANREGRLGRVDVELCKRVAIMEALLRRTDCDLITAEVKLGRMPCVQFLAVCQGWGFSFCYN